MKNNGWIIRSAAVVFLLLTVNVASADSFNEGVAAYNKGDYTMAFQLWEPLAQQGVAAAQSSLGYMYGLGVGVPRDYILAHKWLGLAVAGGDVYAAEGLDTIEKSMTAAQILQARELVRNWRPKE